MNLKTEDCSTNINPRSVVLQKQGSARAAMRGQMLGGSLAAFVERVGQPLGEELGAGKLARAEFRCDGQAVLNTAHQPHDLHLEGTSPCSPPLDEKANTPAT